MLGKSWEPAKHARLQWQPGTGLSNQEASTTSTPNGSQRWSPRPSLTATSLGYWYEGVIGYLYTALPATNGATIYRYWTSNSDHFYSINSTEYLGMAPVTFTLERPLGYCSKVSGKGLCPIYRLYNHITKHVLLTTNYNEMAYWQSNGFTYQFVMCYILCNA